MARAAVSRALAKSVKLTYFVFRMPTEPPPAPRIVLFDGECGLCDKLVRALVRADGSRALRYAPLQGETARKLRAQHPSIPDGLETMVFVDEGVVHLRSRAAFRCARYLSWPWRALAWLRWVPRFLTDPVYGLVARSRYGLFGRSDVCRLPVPGERALFLP